MGRLSVGSSVPFASIHRSSIPASFRIRIASARATFRVDASVASKSRTSTVKTGFPCCAEYFASMNETSAPEIPKIKLRVHNAVTISSSNESVGAFIEEGETGRKNRQPGPNVFVLRYDPDAK